MKYKRCKLFGHDRVEALKIYLEEEGLEFTYFMCSRCPMGFAQVYSKLTDRQRQTNQEWLDSLDG